MKKLSLLFIVSILAFTSCDWFINSPIANAGDDKTITLGETTTLDGSCSGITDKSGVTYSWSENHAEVTLTDDNAATATFSASAAGLYTITLTVTNKGYTSTDSVIITVEDPATYATIENLEYTETESSGRINFTFDITSGYAKSMSITRNAYMYAMYYDPTTNAVTAINKVNETYNVFSTSNFYIYSDANYTSSNKSLSLYVQDFDLTDVNKVKPTVYVQIKLSDLETSTKTPISSTYYDKSKYYSITFDAYRALNEENYQGFTVNEVTDSELIAQLDAAITTLEASSSVED